MTAIDVQPRRFSADRTLALINYGLLFAAIFFAGVPGIVAAVIAYTQKAGADPLLKQHYRFQIQIFWIAFLLALIAGICGLWSVLDMASRAWSDGQVVAREAAGVDVDLSHVRMTTQIMGLAIASFVALILMAIWSLSAPAIGFIRLATARTDRSPV
jgi:uncharacterized membrane protein